MCGSAGGAPRAPMPTGDVPTNPGAQMFGNPSGPGGLLGQPQATQPSMTGDAGMMRPPPTGVMATPPQLGPQTMQLPQQPQVPYGGDAGIMRPPPMTGDAGMMRQPMQPSSGRMASPMAPGAGQQPGSFGLPFAGRGPSPYPSFGGISPAFSAGNVTGGLTGPTAPNQNPFSMLFGGY